MSFPLPDNWPKDPTMVSYGKYLLAFFRGMLPEKPPTFDPIGSDTSTNRCVVNPGDSEKLMQHQLVINMALSGMLAANSPQRGILVYHSTGAGKTIIAMGAMDAAWDTDKRIIFVTNVDTLASNPPSVFYKNAMMFPRFKGKSLDDIEKMFTKRKVEFLSFAQLTHILLLVRARKTNSDKQRIEFENYLKNTVLIMDEIQNIFRPLAGQQAEHDALLQFLMDVNNPRTSHLKMVVLSATPGDSPEECIQLLNMLRNPLSRPILLPDVDSSTSLAAFRKSIAGLVSYVEISSDKSRFPRLVQMAPYRLPMSMRQFVKYLDAFQTNTEKMERPAMPEKEVAEKDVDGEGDDDEVVGQKWFATTRKYSNMLYDYEDNIDVEQFSAKLPKLLDIVSNHPQQKHYIYSSFYEKRGSSQGVLAIGKMMEDKLGYEKFTIKDALKLIASGINKEESWAALGARKRYMLVIMSELNPDVTGAKETRKTRENLASMLAVFNDRRNMHGKYIHVFLASQGFFAAIDLKAIRHLHIFEPFMQYTADIQAIGRARRRCSHADLSFDRDWTVTIHRYMSDMPLELKFTTPEELKQLLEESQVQLAETKEQLDAAERITNSGNANGSVKSAMNKARRLAELDSLRERVRMLTLQVQDLYWKEQARRLKLIDDQIIENTKERSKLLLTIYQAMREAAFDCPLYSEMHGIRCMQEDGSV